MTQVTVIVPCFNERATIGQLLQAITEQVFPSGRIEVIIADGMSTDGTRRIVTDFSATHPKLELKLLDNPDRTIPTGLNRAIQESGGEVIVRFDAHSVPASNYIERCINTLDRTGAANVGGLWEIRASVNTWVGRSIAAAAGHPLGAGGARYRTGGSEGEVETVPFGAFDREWLERVGPFNEDLLTNEDYEFNLRLRQAGGVIWFDPSIRSTYFARGTLRELARQYFRYGYWKGQMLKRYPTSLRWRQALPPLFVLVLALLLVLAPFAEWARNLLLLQMGIYIATTVAAGLLRAVRLRDLSLALGMPLALWTMHLSWGIAFWAGLGAGLFRLRPENPEPEASRSGDV
ncbi:MAG: glycosyltransferase family 2 protein [Chloroflexi bacterium]|nr:glycosyltransferase family 2 protein [Chloroflexota bacterium]